MGNGRFCSLDGETNYHKKYDIENCIKVPNLGKTECFWGKNMHGEATYKWQRLHRENNQDVRLTNYDSI